MEQFFTIGLPLYFPENKLEYIPALFSLLCFMTAAALVMRYILRSGRRQEAKAKELEKQIMEQSMNEQDE